MVTAKVSMFSGSLELHTADCRHNVFRVIGFETLNASLFDDL